ncbi:MAG: molybdopterin molybdotransferase MoeA [Planctomycetes bacterium]|nr:molybdopterin molybdotransferase MoeA [Planctomycetota bacterium]
MPSPKKSPLWGTNPHPLLTLDEAWDCIAHAVSHLDPVPISTEQSLGRVLAAPVPATDDYPIFDKSMMDGFAVRSADCQNPVTELKLAGVIAAGVTEKTTLPPGNAVRINTGAPIPAGADSIVRIENTTLSPDGLRVTIRNVVKPGAHLTRRGQHARRGDILLAPPLLIEAPQIAVLTSNGTTNVSVYPDIDVGIAVTGDELVPSGAPRAHGQIFESNGPMLAALVTQFGATPHSVGIVRDNPADLRSKLTSALRHPVVIAAGGMSLGTLDLVPNAFADLGVEWQFHGVQVRPGKPVAYGRGPNGQHVFGLPGNPVSAYVCAWLFVRMAIRGLQGHAVRPPHRWKAMLTREVKAAKDNRPAFVPARVWNTDADGLVVEPCGWGGSGDPFGAALANALLVRNDPTLVQTPGCQVEVIFISKEM